MSAVNSAKEAFELLQRSSDPYSEQSPEEQARGLKILVSNCILRGRKDRAQLQKTFQPSSRRS